MIRPRGALVAGDRNEFPNTDIAAARRRQTGLCASTRIICNGIAVGWWPSSFRRASGRGWYAMGRAFDRRARLAKIKRVHEMHTEQHVVVVRLGALLLHSGSRAVTDHLDRLSNPSWPGLTRPSRPRTVLAKDAISVSRNPIAMAGSSTMMTWFAAHLVRQHLRQLVLSAYFACIGFLHLRWNSCFAMLRTYRLPPLWFGTIATRACGDPAGVPRALLLIERGHAPHGR